jgi:CubicO group peptidase (beta-lactamase class C family)
MIPAGLSTLRLGRLHGVLSGYVERQYVPGLVALVSGRDNVHVEVLGSQSIDNAAPMRRDTIFRIASITKPIVAVAAMVLVEECKVRLDDAVDPWLPELANRRVLTSLSAPLDESVPAERPITLRDLLTSCMGFGSVMAMPGTYPIQARIRDYRIGGDGPKRPTDFPPADEWLQNLGSLPLIAQPGERWMYNVSSDVLGIFVARVSGQSLGTFMRERIFEPLGMVDTAFHVPPDKCERLSTFYFFNKQNAALDVFDDVEHSTWRDESAFESGSGGLVSTVDDYFAFARMMLNKGRYGHERILSRASVELMTANHLSPQQRAGSEIFFGAHSSWGFGMAVNIAQDEIFHRPGRFGWDGGFGTSAYVDPEGGIIGILLTQRLVDSPEPSKLYTDFWTTTYAASE